MPRKGPILSKGGCGIRDEYTNFPGLDVGVHASVCIKVIFMVSFKKNRHKSDSTRRSIRAYE